MSNNFWKNVLRYPSFFISSMLGLILIILTPLKNILNNDKLRIFIIISIVLSLITLFLILKNMLNF